MKKKFSKFIVDHLLPQRAWFGFTEGGLIEGNVKVYRAKSGEIVIDAASGSVVQGVVGYDVRIDAANTDVRMYNNHLIKRKPWDAAIITVAERDQPGVRIENCACIGDGKKGDGLAAKLRAFNFKN